MNEPQPDERFSAAARAALIQMVDAGELSAAARSPRRWVLQAVVAAVVLGLVVSLSALAIGRSSGLPASTATGSPIPSPQLVSCGSGQPDSFAPFGCGNFISTADGTTDAEGLSWLRSTPIGVGFNGSPEPELGFSTPCNGVGGVPVRLSTTSMVLDSSRGTQTLTLCESARMTQQRQMMDFFDGTVGYVLSGDELTLTHGATVIRFQRTPLPSPTPVLLGTMPSLQSVSCGDHRENGLEPFGCDAYQSVDGHDAQGEIGWFASQPISVRFGLVGSQPTLSLVTPCNEYDNLNLTVEGGQLLVDEHTGGVTTVACGGDRGAHERSAVDFFSEPVSYTLSGGELTLAGGGTVIHLKRQMSPP